MPDNSDNFDSLFDDGPSENEESGTEEELFTFDEDLPATQDIEETPSRDEDESAATKKRKRTSEDFEPDMDALLVTAQSPMIIEGMKYLTMQDYSSKRLTVYAEAIKGVDLYITIIQRNPKKFFKLVETLRNDIDYREVEKTAFNLYNIKFKASPVTEDHIVRAYLLLKDKMKLGYEKALISMSAVHIKKYQLLSGGLNTDVIKELITSGNRAFMTEMAELNKRVNSAIGILKSNSPEIARGLKGKDVNIFLIKSSELLSYYYKILGNAEAAEYYNRINNNYKKYHIIRD